MIDDAMTDPDMTVFVVDDDAGIRSSLVRALSLRGYRVAAFASAVEFLDGFELGMGGCLVLDYGMPGMNGLELQRHLNNMGAQLPVVFITGHGGVPESVQAIKAGAVDFLEKPFRQADLIARIETAFQITRELRQTQARSEQQQARFGRLTSRESEIVGRIVENPREASSKEIASALGISPRTVDHHRARIMEKLGVKTLAELIALASR